MKTQNPFKNFAAFIGKDTIAENESKKLIVVVRILILSLIFYFIMNIFLCNLALEIGGAMMYIIFAIFFVGIFALSYYCRSFTVICIFTIGMIIWIYLTIHYMGWNIGVQHFLMVLLVLSFFSVYKRHLAKIIFAILLCAFRLFLFFMYSSGSSNLHLSPIAENGLQILNTITIFWCISVIVFVFSNDTRELESKLVDYNNKLLLQANTDTLTGLFNRRKAMVYMENFINKDLGESGFSLCICDIDFFKKVNDNYGHDVGDEVLVKIAEIFRQEKKSGTFAARWGGEEFLLVFPSCNGDDAYIQLERIRRSIKKLEFNANDTTFSVTMTYGLAEYDYHNGLTATLKEADEKLYIGKENGRDRIVF